MNAVETPCVVVDYAKMLANIRRMQDNCNKYDCKLRPHIKTHKSVEIARLQMAAGAAGVTCAKVSEAEVMADGGILDIFIAYPLIGEMKTERAAALRKRCKRLILAVDSYECAAGLSCTAVRHDITFEIRLELDTGAKRTGAPLDKAVELAAAVAPLPGLNLTGIFTFKSLIHENAPTLDFRRAAQEESLLMDSAKQAMLKRGIAIQEISAGSTPTGIACAETGLVNEVRPGTYVFYDQMTFLEGLCKAEDIAAKIYATVVSAPAPEYAVLDGGSKTFPTDAALNKGLLPFHSYAYADGREDLRLDRLSEEHGIIRAADGGGTGLAIGDILRLTPAHICPAVNLQNHIYIDSGGDLRKLRVDARGMVC